MDRIELDAIVTRYDLNQHSFYRAWRAGTLPREALAAYAADYAPFIASIEAGWRALGDVDHAIVEGQHAELWGRFRAAVGASTLPGCYEARALVREAESCFSNRVEAIGSLHAFEAQQPSTARSKLDGLREHYALADEYTEYFRVHADDYGERDRLCALAFDLSQEEHLRAAAACERTCQAMWGALDGVMASFPEARAAVAS
jgi:pyrroloquinoline quinone (PQQ) biosynthesis protein C